MKANGTNRSGSPAFTLTELAVIVCVVAVLAIILPLRASVRPQSDRAICMNNQRRLAMAAVMYASDNRDVLPDAGGGGLSFQCWAHGANTPDASNSNARYTNQLANVPKGHLWPYYHDLSVLRCPSDATNTPTMAAWFIQRTLKVTSYGMNGYLMDDPFSSGSPALLLSMFAPSTIFFCEDDYSSPFAFNDASNFPSDLTIPNFVHDAAVVSSADGSAELIPLQTFQALLQSPKANRLNCYPKAANGRR